MPDDLRILAFDTSAAHCAAAVICGARVLSERVEPMAKGQAERLFPLLEELLAEAGLSWSDLDALGVGIGPGNFTGVRISVAAARGLSLSLGIPAIGVSATQAAACDAPRPCRAVVPLRGDEVVWEDFGVGAGGTMAQEAAVSAARQEEAETDAATLDAEPAFADVPRLGLVSGGTPPALTDVAGSGKPGTIPSEPHLVRGEGAEAAKAARSQVSAVEHGALARLDEPRAAAAEARLRSLSPDAAIPDPPGPKLARAGELPPGPPACAPAHPVAVAIARVAAAELTRAAAGALQDPARVLPRPAPLYLRPADAAPPRDPAPVILR